MLQANQTHTLHTILQNPHAHAGATNVRSLGGVVAQGHAGVCLMLHPASPTAALFRLYCNMLHPTSGRLKQRNCSPNEDQHTHLHIRPVDHTHQATKMLGVSLYLTALLLAGSASQQQVKHGVTCHMESHADEPDYRRLPGLVEVLDLGLPSSQHLWKQDIHSTSYLNLEGK